MKMFEMIPQEPTIAGVVVVAANTEEDAINLYKSSDPFNSLMFDLGRFKVSRMTGCTYHSGNTSDRFESILIDRVKYVS